MIGTAGVLVGFLRPRDFSSLRFGLQRSCMRIGSLFLRDRKTSKPTQRGISIRFTAQLLLALLPTIVRGV